MTDIEIPFIKERGFRYRFFEILPGFLSWLLLATPFLLSLVSVTAAAVFILSYLVLWLIRSIGIDVRALQGYSMMRKHQKYDWNAMLDDLDNGLVKPIHKYPKWHFENVARVSAHPEVLRPKDLIHVVIIATVKESREVLAPTIESVIDSAYDKKRIILVLAYEERGGEQTEQQAKELINTYKDYFMHAMCVKHPKDMPGEIVGKGGNVTYAGRKVEAYLKEHNINPINVVLTTLDADNRPDKVYFSALSYTYVACLDPRHISFQPITMYTNNIWDAPAPMRVVATGNSFFNVTLALRPHMLRNFSSHAQSMQTLIDTNYWSVRTVVEDGHQFWRTYFRYDSNHLVFPIYVPIYQDAVFSSTYTKTLKAQFIQLRRWTYGASDVAYVAEKGFFTKNDIPKYKVIAKFFRLLESHVTWAVAPLILAFSALIPVTFNHQSYAANELPLLVSRIQTLALIGVFASLFVSLKSLPPKPARYKAHRSLFMIIQWVYLPVTTIVYNSFSALYSQTRLMFGWYYGAFDVTEKAVAIKREGEDKIVKVS